MESSASSTGTQLITMLLTFLILMVPIAILNGTIAKRKGRNAAEFGWLSVIPFVGFFLAIYLLSLTDKALQDKVDRILQIVSPQAAQPGAVPQQSAQQQNDAWVNRPPTGA